jgi:tRNA-specific 2-thiouridylase
VLSIAAPPGHLHKQQVRAIAAQAGLAPSSKRSSAGICFVGRRDFGAFLESYLAPRPGVFRCVDTQAVLGPCPNMIPWTLGQRARLPGRPAAYFVAGKQLQEGVVWVAQGHEHPALYSRQVLLGPPSWVAGSAPPALQQKHTEGQIGGATPQLSCHAKARYRQQAVACSVGAMPQQAVERAAFRASRFHTSPSLEQSVPAAGEYLQASFVDAQRGLTPGQAFVMYDGDVCLGSSMVLAPGVTDWEVGTTVATADQHGAHQQWSCGNHLRAR